ncbi:MAG: choice-of-anchor J domain-containing protein [Reichenbachiella sp.]|uniref:T9SS-dependent choice-of-anchor J family protein n=1 Tax=Reichenbachiella sp. TaxID=2184521 RepID=UPI0032643054
MPFNALKSGMSSERVNEQFESWLKTIRDDKKVAAKQADSYSETVYQIPVVVHVVHKGEEEGVGANIPEEQIINQIDSLNNDFRRLNVDQENTPTSFLSVAADVKIEFILAKRDPEGLPTDGIVRVQGNQSSYTINDAELLAANSYWPAEEYFNIWVADLSNGLLGFAKFPISNVPGMDEDPNLNRLIDGAFSDYEYFGTGFNADDFSKGRTLTHEIGHWLGLRHIWGDGNCSADDFCSDTPTQSGSTSGCPDEGEVSCSTEDMFQNYMDYTDDVCMNLFTLCQADRMRIVLENSPRRKDLLNSEGLTAVTQVSNDLGIRSIQSPTFGNCNVVLQPEIEVRNYGDNTINSFSLDMLVDDELVRTESFTEPMTELQTIFVNFPEVTVASSSQLITFKVNQVNDETDGNVDNDCRWISTFFPVTESVPFVDEFTGSSDLGTSSWNLKNSNDNPSAWGYVVAPNLTTENESAVLSYYGAPGGSFGELDYFISPVFDLTELATADLRFKYAYSGYPDNYSDALTVVVSTDCGATFPEENILFQKIGASLATTTATSSLFVPSDPSQWLEVEKNFGEFANNPEVIVAFIGVNGGGNNLYLDDIEIFSSASNNYDLGILQVEEIPVVTCNEDFGMGVFIKNYGKQTINNFSVGYSFGTRQQTFLQTDLTLAPGKTEKIEIESFNNVEGDYQIVFNVSEPNGQTDENPENNVSEAFFNIDFNVEAIPLREKFSREMEDTDWHFIQPDGPSDWSIAEFRDDDGKSDYAAMIPGYEITELGIENWLVSPILDFSEAEVASVFYNISYANRVGRNDELRILASTNCGVSYDQELYSEKGGGLAVTQSESAWTPESEEDWRRDFVDLSGLVGQEDVRIAFVVSNQNGNNLYLDDIEFYVSDDPSPLQIEQSVLTFPNPASTYIDLTFNFNIKEEVLVRIISMDGDVISEQSFPNTLNQTYRIANLAVANDGLYVVHVLGDNTNLVSKVYLVK